MDREGHEMGNERESSATYDRNEEVIHSNLTNARQAVNLSEQRLSSVMAEDEVSIPPALSVNDTDNGPSLQNPTWDFLFNNFKKVDLQKHCLDLGLRKIWVTKDKLVDMIMAKSASLKNSSTASSPNEQETQQIDSDGLLQKIMSDIVALQEKLNEKDSELGVLHAKLENAEEEILGLQKRIILLENH